MAVTVHLIDGHSYAYRSFFGIPHLSNRKGQPTQAVYGFAVFLLKLLREAKAAEIVVTFDPRGPTFRHKAFEQYKAQRKPMPDDLASQLPLIHELVAALGVRKVEKEGYEADDVLATLARRTREEGKQVVIHSGDKDILQLVGPGVRVVVPRKGEEMDPAQVRKRWGVGPEQMVELLALMGDTSDNLPGVPGVGEKTAAALLGQFGSLDAIFSRLDEVKSEKLRQKLIGAREQVYRTCELARLKDDLPLVEEGGSGPDEERVRELFAELEFSRLTVPVSSGPAEAPTVELGEVPAGPEPEAREKVSASMRRVFEMAPRAGCVLTDAGLALAAGEGRWLIPAAEASRGLESFWRNPKVRKVTFGLKELSRSLLAEQVDPAGMELDIQLAAYLVTGRRLSLSEIAREFLGTAPFPEEEPPARRAARALDALAVLPAILEKKVEELGLSSLLRDVEMPLAPVLAGMELAGIRLDRKRLDEVSIEIRGKLERLQAEIVGMVGDPFNLLSPKQVGEVLFSKLNLPTKKKTKTGFSTNEAVLEELSILHPVPGRILEYRKLAKLLGTYLESLPGYCAEDGILRTTFHQMGTATGRLSSSDPNLQNIPARGETGKSVRSAFVPRSRGTVLVSADYSQIELRILADMSGDSAFLNSFEKGEDVHAATAAEMFGRATGKVTADERRAAKAVNFGIVYGMTPFGLARELKCPPGQAKEYLDRFFEKHPSVRTYWDETLKAAREKGYVSTRLGRRRYIPEIANPARNRREEAEREALNHPIQGTAADCIKLAMIMVSREVPEARLLLSIHDELVFEVQEREAGSLGKKVVRAMEGVMDLKAPLKVEAAHGASWAECH